MGKFPFHKKRCITKKLWNLAKKRNMNKTKKGMVQFKKSLHDIPTKYLTVDELYTQPCEPKNDILKYIKKLYRNKTKLQSRYKKRMNELTQ